MNGFEYALVALGILALAYFGRDRMLTIVSAVAWLRVSFYFWDAATRDVFLAGAALGLALYLTIGTAIGWHFGRHSERED